MTLKKLEAWIEKNRRLVLTVILGVNLFLCLALFDPKPYCGGDNAYYTILAQSLLQTGDGYSTYIATGIPEPFTIFPFGYPLILAPLIALFGVNLLLFKFLSLAIAMGSVILLSVLVRPLLSPLQWAVLTLAVAVNPEIINFSHWILSDIPFFFFSLLSLIFFLQSEASERERPGYRFWLAVFCIAIAIHFRQIGVAFTVAGFAYYAISRKWRKLTAYTLGLTILVSPWMIRNILVQEVNYASIQDLFFLKAQSYPDLGTLDVQGMGARISGNIRSYSTDLIASSLVLGFGSVQNGNGIIVGVISFCLTVLILLGFSRNLFSRTSILKLYFIIYTGIILIYPSCEIRYLLPLVPFLIMYLANGVTAVVCSIKRTPATSTISWVLVVFAVAMTSLGMQVVRIPANLQMIRQYLHGDRYAGYLPSWRHFFEAADWARENTSESSVFTVRKPSLFYLQSGRKSTQYSLSRDADSVFSGISKTDYVVISLLRAKDQLVHIHKTTSNYLVPAMEKHPERFKLLLRTGKPSTLVWQVTKTDQYEASDSSTGKEPDNRPDFTSFQQLITNDSTDIEMSIAYYRQILEKEEFNFEALKNLAFLCWQLEKLEESAKYYELAAEARPLDEYMLHYAGKLNQILERYERAKIYYNRLLAENPGETATLVNMGMIEFKQGRPEKAEEFYLKALAVDSTDSSANYNYANLFFMTKRLDLAEKHYKKVLEKEPYDSKTHRFLGRLYLKDPARYEEALNHFTILCRLVPQEKKEIEEKYIKPLQVLIARSALKP